MTEAPGARRPSIVEMREPIVPLALILLIAGGGASAWAKASAGAYDALTDASGTAMAARGRNTSEVRLPDSTVATARSVVRRALVRLCSWPS
jgi:hypothetical protein